MKCTHLIGLVVGLLASIMLAQDAFGRARMYNPRLGRFMQRDPVGTPIEPAMTRNVSGRQFTQRDPQPTAQYADGMNLYQYVTGNPVRWVDPTGLDRWLADDLHLHHGICVDEWAPTDKQVCCDGAQRRCWQKTGKRICFDFSTFKENPAWIITILPSIVVGPGTVTEGPDTGRTLENRGPSGCKADRALLTELRRQVGDPPLYSLLGFNCNTWSWWYYDFGSDQNPRSNCPCDTCD